MTEAAVLRVALGLGLVIAAILAMAWLARRSGLLQRQHGGVLKLVGSLSVGPRQNIVVVQVRDTWVVVGITPNAMTPLHTLPADAPDDPDSDAPQPGGDLPSSFSATLARRLGDVLKRP